MKLVSLPKSNQKGINEEAVNVPADLGPVYSLMPHFTSDVHCGFEFKAKSGLQVCIYKAYYQTYAHISGISLKEAE